MMGDRKLSSEQVWEIRRKYAGGNTCNVLAMEYGVSTATISNYVVGVKREPADRHERVSFGGDPLPSELNFANAGNGAADKQRGKDKPGSGDKAVDMAKDGGAVTADSPGDTDIKNMSGEDKQEVSGADKPENSAEKPGSAAEKQRGDTKKPGRATKKPGRATKKAGDDSAKDKAAEEKESFIFTKKLRMLFDESGKTYGEMGAFFKEKTGKGITNEAIRNWCKGSYFPGVINIPVIAEFFGVSVEYLLTDTEDKGAKVVESGADGLDVCDLATGFFMFLEENIRGDISINILRHDGIVEIKISEKDEELAFKRRVGGSGGGGA